MNREVDIATSFDRRDIMLERFARFSLAVGEINRCWHRLAADEIEKYDRNSPHAVYLNTLHQFEEGITANLQVLSREGLPQK